MYPKTEEQRLPAVPMRSAVLCVDCESITNSRFESCPVCGSHSIFNIASMLGGSLLTPEEIFIARDAQILKFDLTISITLNQLEAREVNAAVEGFTELLRLRLGGTRASLHIEVEPVATAHGESPAKAA